MQYHTSSQIYRPIFLPLLVVRRCSPSKHRKKIEEAHHNLQQEWIDQDKIFSYDQLVDNLNEHLQSLNIQLSISQAKKNCCYTKSKFQAKVILLF